MFAVFLLACDTTETQISDKCTVDIVQPTETFEVGSEVSVIASPLSEAWDTVVTIDELSSLVTGLDRDNCEQCDQCKEQYECYSCYDCDSCDYLCKTTCIEKVNFIVPEGDEKSSLLHITNRYGQSPPISVDIVLPSLDTGTNDSGQ